jgi:arylsulfatase A
MRKPNVIYILADDMGYGDFGVYNPDIKTEALDCLVKNGTTLSECYSASPVCAPARAAIMTGRYPHRTGVIDTLEARGLDRLKTTETTLGDVFGENGYETALIGKWHLGAIDERYHPNNRGFNYFFGFRGGWSDYYNYNLERNGIAVECDHAYLTDVFSDDAVDYIKKNKNNPFFMHLTYNAPHFPCVAPENLVEKYEKTGKFTKEVCVIYAMIEAMDNGIKKVIDTIEECGLLEDTIIVFSSDNGPDLGNEGGPEYNRFNCDLRGEKQFVYEGGIKVPAVIRYDGKIEKNHICHEVVHGTDWFPTLLKLCEIEIPNNLVLDGIDVHEIFEGKKLPERTLYWQWCRFEPEEKCNSAIRTGNMKLVYPAVDVFMELDENEERMDRDIKVHPEKYIEICKDPIPTREWSDEAIPELYDLESDPSESLDLINGHKQEADKMKEKIHNWFIEVEKDRLN